jgi:hypothetical protein
VAQPRPLRRRAHPRPRASRSAGRERIDKWGLFPPLSGT